MKPAWEMREVTPARMGMCDCVVQLQQEIQGAQHVVLVADRRAPEQQEAAALVAEVQAVEQAAVTWPAGEHRLHELRPAWAAVGSPCRPMKTLMAWRNSPVWVCSMMLRRKKRAAWRSRGRGQRSEVRGQRSGDASNSVTRTKSSTQGRRVSTMPANAAALRRGCRMRSPVLRRVARPAAQASMAVAPEVEGGPGVVLRADDAPLHLAQAQADLARRRRRRRRGFVWVGCGQHVLADGPGRGQGAHPRPLPSQWERVQGRGRKHRRERIPRKHGDEPAVAVHRLHQRVEDGAHDLRHTSAPCWPCAISADVMALKPDMSTNSVAASNWPEDSPAAYFSRMKGRQVGAWECSGSRF